MFIKLFAAFLFINITISCVSQEREGDMVIHSNDYKTGRLQAKLNSRLQKKSEVVTGLKPLRVGSKKDGLIYIPKNYTEKKPAALAVMLHGAGGTAEHGLSLLRKYAEDKNIILIAPASRNYTWDIIARDSFDADVIFIDQALALAFDHYEIDSTRIAIGGFSDGASYALSMGLTNGDLFTHVIAFSPGFAYTVQTNGSPEVFISHGTSDTVLPIDACSRRIVSQLKRNDIMVSYHEFDKGHEVPSGISKNAIEWFLK